MESTLIRQGQEASPSRAPAATRFRYREGMTVMFVAILIISNLVGQKICAFGPFRVSGGQVLFPSEI